MSIGILKTITVDFSDDAVYQYVAVKSEEVFSRVIEVILMNDGAEYIIPQGTTARLEARKSDNVPILIDGTIDYTLNRIYFSLTPKCTEIPGIIQCEIALYGEDNRLAISSFFYIDVHRSVLSGTGSANGCGNNVVSSSPEYEAFRTGLLALDDKIKQSNEVVGVVQKQMEEAREALDIATEAAETIVTARDEAFLAAESANNSASLANEATQAANEAVKTIDGVAETATKAADEATLATQEAERIATAVVTAENARVVAEQERVSNEATRKNDEAKRVIAENNRVAAETARVEAEKLRVRESADAVDDAIDAATAANAASQNANNAIANLNTAINNANVAASYANQAAENVITTNGKMIAAEAERESAEETRQANESTRINQENARVDAELERESAFATAISNAETATQNANDAAQTAIEASQEASLQEAREAAISASESANAAADRATSFLDDAEANEEIRKSNEISRVSAEENRRTEFATWEIELGKISAFDKRIENLEVAVNPGLVSPMIDDAVAYVKDVPTGALPNAMISEIGGMSRKCENLIPFPYDTESKTVNGVTYAINSDGSVSVSGTPTENTAVYLTSLFDADKAKYFISLQGSFSNMYIAWDLFVDGNREYQSYHTAYGFDLTGLEGKPQLRVGLMPKEAGVVVSGTCKPTLNKGDAALPYEPYFEGLRDAKVTAVESFGANRFSGEVSFKTAPTTYSFANGTLKLKRNGGAMQGGVWSKEKYKSGTYTISFNLSGMSNTNFVLATTATASATNTGTLVKTWFANGQATYTLTLTEDRYIGFFTDGTVEITASNIMLNQGSSALAYIPYFKNIFEIPEAVQALDGYGEGIPGGKCNLLSLEDKKYYKNVKRANLTGIEIVSYENHSASSDTQQFNVTISDCDSGLVLCDRLPSSWDAAAGRLGVSSLATQLIMGVPKSWLTPFGFVDGTASTYVSSFVAYLKNEYSNGTPVTVVYALATPTETDLSDYFGEDNLIGVEGGGTVTMVNEYEYDVPSVIEYTVKGVDAI